MAFWTDHTGNDPKRNYRFIVELAAFEAGATWFAKKVTKPSFKVTEAKHSYLNHNFYYPGRVEWNDITVTLVDPVSPNATSKTMEILQASGYSPPFGPDDTTTMSKSNAVSKLQNVNIRQIDHKGDDLEKWVLRGVWISDVSFSELSYENDDLTEIILKFRYDWAELDGTIFAPAAGSQLL
jgi:hypothetical protein